MWSVFGLIHSFLISVRFASWARRIMGQYFAFYRLTYNLFSLILFVIILSFTRTLDSELVIQFSPPWTIIQSISLLTSCVVMIWAFLSYDYLEFVGIRQIIDLSKKKDSTHPKTIIKKGLLGIVRHPMYLATIIFMWSLDSTRADVLTHIVLTIYILVGIIFEERKLVKQHGTVYIEYRKVVPALIPFTKK
ncbi:MAG: NnrU family protein [Desulfosporosinus sp.]|nr:NnrU family protein [Desulfosporosinus sp.]